MRVTSGDRTLLNARAVAEPKDDFVAHDHYTVMYEIRLRRDPTEPGAPPPAATEVILNDTDIGRLVECAVRHPSPQMRSVVLSAIWNDPETFRRIFEFGLDAPAAFQDIRDIVAEALAQRAPAAEAPPTSGDKPLLPRVPLPAHLQDRARKGR
jgi:hypothetical protein